VDPGIYEHSTFPFSGYYMTEYLIRTYGSIQLQDYLTHACSLRRFIVYALSSKCDCSPSIVNKGGSDVDRREYDGNSHIIFQWQL
jgi:hypothetical protein